MINLENLLIDSRVLADYDGSAGEITDGSMIADMGIPKQGYASLFDANPILNAHIQAQAIDNKVKKISIHCFSARNNALANILGATMNKNGCAIKGFTGYAKDLKIRYGDKIELEKMLFQDFHERQKPGWVWEHIVKDQVEKVKNICPMGDQTKIILYFVHAWHAHHNRLPNCLLSLEIFDDKQEILEKISEFIKINPGLQPPQSRTIFHCYGHIVDSCTGEDRLYEHDVIPELFIENKNPIIDELPFDIRKAAEYLEDLLMLDYDNKIQASKLPENLTIHKIKRETGQSTIAPPIKQQPVVSVVKIEQKAERVEERNETSCCSMLYYYMTQCFRAPPDNERTVPLLKKQN